MNTLEHTAIDRKFGSVIWFSDDKGYGFLRAPDLRQEVFVHFRALGDDARNPATGRKRLLADQQVEFNLVWTDKGPKAENVRVIPQERRNGNSY